jgi:biopolymer transport protein ExbD
VDPSEGNLVVTVDGDGRVTVDGEPTAMEDVSVRAAEIAAGESVALVTTIRADRAVPYRHIEELQHELVDAGLTRVVFVTDDIAEGGNGLRIVLPESNEGLSVSARNFLSLTVQPSGIVEVKRGESPAVQQMLALQLTGLWRAEASRNPNLIAAISTHEDTQYSHVLAVLDALYEANAQRISLWGIFAL